MPETLGCHLMDREVSPRSPCPTLLLWAHPEMSGLCRVPSPELGSCPAHSPRAAQGHESFPGTLPDSSLQHGQGLPGLCCHCQSLAGTSALRVSPCPAPARGAPRPEGWTRGALCTGAHPSPASRGFPGDGTLWKLQQQLKVFVLTGFMSPHTHTGCSGLCLVRALQTRTPDPVTGCPSMEGRTTSVTWGERPLLAAALALPGHCWVPPP